MMGPMAPMSFVFFGAVAFLRATALVALVTFLGVTCVTALDRP